MKILYEFKREPDVYIFVIAESIDQARQIISEWTGEDYSNARCIDDEVRVHDDEICRVIEQIHVNS